MFDVLQLPFEFVSQENSRIAGTDSHHSRMAVLWIPECDIGDFVASLVRVRRKPAVSGQEQVL
jgi:hypothetical protein